MIIVAQVYFCPESPRWYMMKGRYTKAFESLRLLRHTDVQAARDLYCLSHHISRFQYAHMSGLIDIHVLLEEEKRLSKNTQNKFLELFTVPRNRRATLASSIIMFMCDSLCLLISIIELTRSSCS